MKNKLISMTVISMLSTFAHAQYTPVKGDIINTEVESTFSNLLDGSDKHPVPVILKVNSVKFMGYNSDYVFKTYSCKLIASASMPSNEDFEVRNKKVFLLLDSLVCHKKMKNKDKYVVTDVMHGWGMKNNIIGITMNKDNGLDIGDKIQFFVNKEGVTTLIYRKFGSNLDNEAQSQAEKLKE